MDGTYKPVFKHSSSAGLTSLTATNVATLNQWYHVTGVVDRPAGTVKTYVNGVLDKSGTFLGNSPATAVGESPFSLTSSVNASFDEVRAESKARSAEWVKATFDNQKTASNNFWTFGTATGPPVLASSLTDETFAKDAYTYTMVATGSPSGYAAFGLPNGLTVNPSTGVISGTPSVATTAAINLVFEYPNGSLLGSLDDNNASALIMTLLVKPKPPVVKTKAATGVSATRPTLKVKCRKMVEPSFRSMFITVPATVEPIPMRGPACIRQATWKVISPSPWVTWFPARPIITVTSASMQPQPRVFGRTKA
jgi:hypothetical protein